ncbi:hypothetical protein RP20_CCG021584 [Aedes albopictus]|nr:hypothetical protein RP20_CCG021584 [Aedes albopictus]
MIAVTRATWTERRRKRKSVLGLVIHGTGAVQNFTLDLIEFFLQLHHSSKEARVARTPSPEEEQDNPFFNQGALKHRFKFTSAYRHNIGDETQEATTFQGQWVTVDYLFYTKYQCAGEKRLSENNLKLVATYALPTVKQAREIYTIPNMYFGSDHFALAGRFLLKAQREPNL